MWVLPAADVPYAIITQLFSLMCSSFWTCNRHQLISTAAEGLLDEFVPMEHANRSEGKRTIGAAVAAKYSCWEVLPSKTLEKLYVLPRHPALYLSRMPLSSWSHDVKLQQHSSSDSFLTPESLQEAQWQDFWRILREHNSQHSSLVEFVP